MSAVDCKSSAKYIYVIELSNGYHFEYPYKRFTDWVTWSVLLQWLVTMIGSLLYAGFVVKSMVKSYKCGTIFVF